MATSREFMEYIYGQIKDAGDVRYRKMFGEYGVYLDGKFIAVVCDGQLFVKITQAGRAAQANPKEAPPYEGAGPYFLMEDPEDRELLVRVLRATWTELPMPKPKKSKQQQ